MSRYIIFDLDGCIADDRERQPLIDHSQPDPWEAYHKGCANDPLINGHYITLAKAMEFIPAIFTSRPEIVRGETQQWLEKVAGLDTKLLFMRPNDDRAPSVELKERFLRKLEQAYSPAYLDVAFALDDRREILDMYKRYSIPTVQTFYPEGMIV